MGGGNGLFWIWGFGGFSQVPKPETYLYQKAALDANLALVRARTARSRMVPAPTWTTFATVVLAAVTAPSDGDPPLIRTRADQGSLRTRFRRPAAPAAPLASFYGPEGKFGWPADAPTDGDLALRRAAIESACQAVLDEVKHNSVASIAKVTDAREKLLDYGRPALQYGVRRPNPASRRRVPSVPAVPPRVVGASGESRGTNCAGNAARAEFLTASLPRGLLWDHGSPFAQRSYSGSRASGFAIKRYSTSATSRTSRKYRTPSASAPRRTDRSPSSTSQG